MMIRDRLKDVDYFEIFIKQNERLISKGHLTIKEKEKEWDVDKIKYKRLSIFENSLEILIAMYSEGRSIDEIKEYYSTTVLKYCKDGWFEYGGGGYTPMLWMLSIGIMLEINQPEFNLSANLVKENNLNDFLLNKLISYRIPNWEMNTEKFAFYRPYNVFSEIIALPKEQATKRLEKYLDKEWYKGNNDTGWHNSHKSEFELYFGYWSFESGAIAKIMDLDDATLKECQYYPYDMVHWKK
jgi:hypothetical protein